MKLCTNFDDGTKRIKEKYLDANYPSRFIDSIIKVFSEKNQNSSASNARKDDKPIILIRIPYCEKNEKIATNFLSKLQQFTGKNYNFRFLWQMRKIKTLFKIKDAVKHRSNVIYKGTSVNDPQVTYIGETSQIARLRWNQHEDPKHNSAPSKHLQEHKDDQFKWEVLTTSSPNWLKRKIHEALFICKLKPTLNAQIDHRKFVLFRSGVT